MDTTQTQILVDIYIESVKLNAKIDALASVKLNQTQMKDFQILADKAFQAGFSKFSIKYRDLLSENNEEILQSISDQL